MTAQLFTLKPPNNGLRRVASMRPATLYAFPEQSPSARAEVHSLQASNLVALSFDLYIAGLRLCNQLGLSVLGVRHRSNNMEQPTCPKTHEPQAELIAENTVRTIPPSEPA